MYRLTIRIRSDDTIRPNTNTLFGPLFGTEANTRQIFGTSLAESAVKPQSINQSINLQSFLPTSPVVLAQWLRNFGRYNRSCHLLTGTLYMSPQRTPRLVQMDGIRHSPGTVDVSFYQCLRWAWFDKTCGHFQAMPTSISWNIPSRPMANWLTLKMSIKIV